MELTLKRVLFSNDGTIGVLINGNRPICLTLERDWLDNAKGLSCIPEGSYLCVLGDHPKHGTTYEVTNVPGRDAILIHSGNTEADTEGCILIGNQYGLINGALAVLNSKITFDAFMTMTNGAASFALHIKNC